MDQAFHNTNENPIIRDILGTACLRSINTIIVDDSLKSQIRKDMFNRLPNNITAEMK